MHNLSEPGSGLSMGLPGRRGASDFRGRRVEIFCDIQLDPSSGSRSSNGGHRVGPAERAKPTEDGRGVGVV
jgi:hypothetical protein